jgi:hypothetical protein
LGAGRIVAVTVYHAEGLIGAPTCRQHQRAQRHHTRGPPGGPTTATTATMGTVDTTRGDSASAWVGAELGSQPRPGGRLPSGISCLLGPSTCYLDVHLHWHWHLHCLTRYFLSHVIYMPTYLGTYLCHVPFETKTQSPTPNSARRDAGEATLDRHTMMAKGTRCLFFSCVLCSVSCAYLSMSSARPYRYRASPPAIAPMYLYLPSAIQDSRH